MKVFYLLILIIIAIFIICYFNYIYFIKEDFCYGNVYCNGNKNNSLCINQECLKCGLQASCTKNEECGPNLCIDGCCDTM
jgi:hypothetical protein